MKIYQTLLICGFAPSDYFPVFILGGVVLVLLSIAGFVEYFSKDNIDDIDGEE
jgi:hypothetical protein